MQITSLILGIVIGVVIATPFAWFIGKQRSVLLQGKVQSLEERNTTLEQANLAATSIDQMLKPVQKAIDELKIKSDDADRRRIEAESILKTEMKLIKERNESLDTSTRQIAAAMGKGQTRGQYGEMQLEQLLKHAGLLEGTHFLRQDSRVAEDGIARPDISILLAGGGEVVIDAKFPWDAFFDAMGFEDLAQRNSLLDKHSKDLLKRINELSNKQYQSTATKSPNFVILFLPFESLLTAALDFDGLLLEKAFGKNVIPATPTTMLGLLRTIAFGWNEKDLNSNAEEIRNMGAEMLKRLAKLVEHIENLRAGLNKAVDGYNSFVSSFDRQAVSQAKRLAQKGVPSNKQIDAPGEISTGLTNSRYSGETGKLELEGLED
ncbi:MAG: DNA recombination protein RmuC [Actinomycetes bacterium]